MNNNFDNTGMNPVVGNTNPVPNNMNLMNNNVVDPNVNVVPTNPTYVDNSMLNNNASLVPNVHPVVDNAIVSVENNETVDNKRKPNILVTLFLLVLAIGVGILAMNTGSIFFGSEPDLILEEDFETGVKEYVARKNKETEMYTLYKTEKDGIVVMLKSKLDKDNLMRPEYEEKYKFSKDIKLYTYNCIYKYDENGNEIAMEYVSKFDMADIDYLIEYNDGRYPAVYIETKGKTVVQMVMYVPDNLKERYQ